MQIILFVWVWRIIDRWTTPLHLYSLPTKKCPEQKVQGKLHQYRDHNILHKKAPECINIPEQIILYTENYHLHSIIFFHPDCTVGFGIAPNHALRLVGFTTGRELHPALKILFNLQRQYTQLSYICQGPPLGNSDPKGTSGPRNQSYSLSCKMMQKWLYFDAPYDAFGLYGIYRERSNHNQ